METAWRSALLVRLLSHRLLPDESDQMVCTGLKVIAAESVVYQIWWATIASSVITALALHLGADGVTLGILAAIPSHTMILRLFLVLMLRRGQSRVRPFGRSAAVFRVSPLAGARKRRRLGSLSWWGSGWDALERAGGGVADRRTICSLLFGSQF